LRLLIDATIEVVSGQKRAFDELHSYRREADIGAVGMTVRAVLFDLDDTLLDDRGAMADAVLLFRQRHSLVGDAPDQVIAARWDSVGREVWRRMALGELSRAEQRRLRLRRVFELTASDSELDELFDSYLECYEKSWRLLPGAETLLSATAHLPRAIVTNCHGDQALKKLRQVGLDGVFRAVVTPESCGGARKPDAIPFTHALALLHASPSNAIMIGDNEEADLAPARSLGMHAVRVADDLQSVLAEVEKLSS
jgi:putative hydrolase of the HAD superfamily